MEMEADGHTLLPFPGNMASSQVRFMRFLRMFLRRAHWLSIAVHLENASLHWLSSFPVSLNGTQYFVSGSAFREPKMPELGLEF